MVLLRLKTKNSPLARYCVIVVYVLIDSTNALSWWEFDRLRYQRTHFTGISSKELPAPLSCIIDMLLEGEYARATLHRLCVVRNNTLRFYQWTGVFCGGSLQTIY